VNNRSFRVVVAASAADRLNTAIEFLRSFQAPHPVTIIGATRGAADDLARRVASERAATFGVTRLSLTQFAARTALTTLAASSVAPGTWLGAEAVATRAAFDAARETALRYFEPVASTPGFPRALARTLQEARLEGLESNRFASLPLAGPDLANLLERFDAFYRGAAIADRATLFDTAAVVLRTQPVAGAVLLLDVPVDHAAERRLIEALAFGTGDLMATTPAGERRVTAFFASIGGEVEQLRESRTTDLSCLREHLFRADARPPRRQLDGSLEMFSAPGEGRECVEIARRVLRCARDGIRFDDMAILVRSPHNYFGLIEHALRRANVPAWFDHGTRRPHPAGRAFLALLACAAEDLSATRFAEYLSLGQVPPPDGVDDEEWLPSLDEALGSDEVAADDEFAEEEARDDSEPVKSGEPVTVGTLRAPWQWEQLLGEAAVIGQSAERWRRRLEGSQREVERRIQEARREDGDEGAKVRGLTMLAEHLTHLRTFALPVIDTLASWPESATWGEWLDAFERLVPRVLRAPASVLRVLADLRPMASVGPIDLDEARRVLADRLLTVESPPPARRFGAVFVGTPGRARGRSFRVVFVPGLAERMFPQKPREDPLLLDHLRRELDSDLPTQSDRNAAERLLLQIAAGAASERLYVSYPRIELTESRVRVPSFYALDLMRAATGTLPDHETLEESARTTGSATLAWPAPSNPDEAIDDQEHDLSVLRKLLDESPDRVRGHAHYLLSLNDCLRRSVIDRWARGQTRWSPSDGLTRVPARIQDAIASQRLTARAYSLSALQKFSACPYQFVLSAIHRLQPLERPEPLQRMDPLIRGSIFHEIQARFFRRLKAAGELPVTGQNLGAARTALAEALGEVAEATHDELAPAVERVWSDELSSIRRDLEAWLEYLARDGQAWEPTFFELGFGKVPGERDVSSVAEDAVLEGGFRLRGAIDLVEEHREMHWLRVTDHKTGRRPDRLERVIVGGGAVLQPLLYPLAIEAALGRTVHHGRLFYCTSAGGFTEHAIPLNEANRAAALEVLQVIDRAIAAGFLAAAPSEEACSRCDFVPVCGPNVHRRVSRKPQMELADLVELRSRP
jgi:CRISPR/Cas system-associated exonuclease Cas4 (RecB family)